MNKNDPLVYVGTYTQGDSEGIYIYHLDMDSGDLNLVGVAKDIVNPSFLAIEPEKRYLYAVNEVGNFNNKPTGAVSAFAIDRETGKLTFLNHQSSEGSGPCYISIDSTGRFALIANYGSGSVAILPIESDGKLAEASDMIQHEGSSVNSSRQEGPHAHSITPDSGNKYAFAPDLGLDKIIIYNLDLENGKLVPNKHPWAEVKAGSGPRHFVFHPNNKYAYVINELNSTMIAFEYDEVQGKLNEIQTISTIPDDYNETNYCADIHVHPSGKFVYGSNRGHDTIVIFFVDEDTGKLTLIGYESTKGNFPRGFALDPTGEFLLAANQNTDNIVTYRIHQETGNIEPTGCNINVSKPVCIKVIKF
ncbi:beta-propeller fold lactonase family protein [Candidatus Poribacteria bacterium]|nr:beta-propeller fold lactonase family protein [Candidatus Poribacteria bacterium]